MSIKVHYAWRIKAKDLEKFMGEFRTHVFNVGVDFFNNLVAVNLKDPPAHIVEKIGLEKAKRVMEIREVVETLYEQSLSPFRNPSVDLECGLRIFPDGSFFNIRPWGEYHMFKDFSSEVGKDWSYWDNSDKPEGISSKEWARRKTSWNRVDDSFVISCTVLGIKEWGDRYNFLKFYATKMKLDFRGLEFVREYEVQVKKCIGVVRGLLEPKDFECKGKDIVLDTLDQLEIKLKLKGKV